MVHLTLTFIELCGEIFFELITLHVYQKSKVNSLFMYICTCLYSVTSLCSHHVLQWASLDPQNTFSDGCCICYNFVQVTSRSISSTNRFWMGMIVFLLMRLRIALLVKLSCHRLNACYWLVIHVIIAGCIMSNLIHRHSPILRFWVTVSSSCCTSCLWLTQSWLKSSGSSKGYLTVFCNWSLSFKLISP